MTDADSTPEGEEPRSEAAAPPPDPHQQVASPSDMASETESEEEPAGEAGGADQVADDELAVAQMELAERTADLQRLQAEFLNYKRRVDRDRELVRENATYAALTPIVDVLDTIDRAHEHAKQSGQGLDPGFKAVADQLERVVGGLGLTKFGAPGDPFDPSLHDALSHVGEDPEVEVTTCKVVAKSGYRIGERVVRAAQVLVVDPASTSDSASEPEQAQPEQAQDEPAQDEPAQPGDPETGEQS